MTYSGAVFTEISRDATSSAIADCRAAQSGVCRYFELKCGATVTLLI